MDEPKHPTYGTLDEFLAELRNDIAQGYYIRIGQQGALNWYAEEFSRLRQDVAHNASCTPNDA